MREFERELVPNMFRDIRDEIDNTSVVILAGGSGKRMNIPFPKSLLELREGYTLLDREIQFYLNCGFNDFVFILGFGADKILKHLKEKRYDEKIKYRVSIDPTTENWGKGKALKYALQSGIIDTSKRAIISFPDDLKLDKYLPLKLLLTHLYAKDHYNIIGTIVLTHGYSFPFGVAKVENNFVKEFVEKPYMNVFVSIGMYLFEKEIWNIIHREIDMSERKSVEFEDIVLPKLAKENKLYSLLVSSDSWIPINDMKAYELAKKIVNSIK
ncbi:MAG: UTP--glucose-1-phosphate uridylyltransferase, partial [Candidatus Aenigmatarchaeota archaeon]